MHHLLNARDITLQFLDRLFTRAHSLEAEPNQLPLVGKILLTLFFEPSTRTRMSFESAMLRLGGQVISVENGMSASTQKGETLEDMGRVISGYGDIVAMRHPEAGSVAKLAAKATIPVINAGDGANEHPTQALLDLYSLHKLHDRLDGLTVGFVGDLKFGRTVHSLLQLLRFYQINFVFIAPKALELPATYRDAMAQRGARVHYTDSLLDVVDSLDVLYVTRVQRERFANLADFEQVRGSYQVNENIVQRMHRRSVILHPLPRVDEIAPEVDAYPQAYYFQQAQNGLYVRMALLQTLLSA